MSKMGDLMIQIEELAQRGMSARFIAVTLGVPMSWAEEAVREVEQYEHLEMQYQMMMDAERSADEDASCYGERY
jgi:hypothetical protein